MTTDRQAQMAHGQILIGIQRLAGKYPFHAKTLERFDIRARPEVGTMGVTVAGNDVLLLYSPQFVLQTPLNQLLGVLLHEVHHCIFGHIVANPADYPDQWARTVAEEITVNEFITEPLPDGAIKLEQFPELPPMESTDQRYSRLKEHRRRFPLSGLLGDGSGDGIGIKIGAGIGTTVSSTGTKADRKPDRHGVNGPCKRQGKGRTGVVIDNHVVWREATKSPQQAQAALKAVFQDAAIDVGLAKVPAGLRRAMQAMGIGHLPGGWQEDLQGTARGRLKWVQLLRRYIGQELAKQPDFLRPARRFPKLVGIVPGRRRRGGHPRILAVIDTSGSITGELLELISAELGRLAGEHSVIVAECDTEIHRVYPYKQLRTVHGRGGTDLRPPLTPKFVRAQHADLVIYFTDDFGPAPHKPPHVPVLWCLTPDGEKPAKWGRVIRMSTAEGNGGGDVIGGDGVEETNFGKGAHHV